jgi:O-antigen/teichoic acid export membrane protein
LQEADVLLIGAVLPIKYVAIYSVGANFANQLRSVPLNALAPVMTVLGQTLGREGREALIGQFLRIQRAWVQFIAGWCIVGAAAMGFGITSWLGHSFLLSGIVGAMVLVGNLFYLGPSLTNLLLGLLDRPGDEARFSGVMVATNVVLTIPLVFLGPVGVAAATAVGQLGAAIWLVRRIRRTLPAGGRPFIYDVPVPACLISAAVVVAMELALRPVVPHGPLGLVVCGLPAGLGLLLYAVLVLGPAQARAQARGLPARLRRRGA